MEIWPYTLNEEEIDNKYFYYRSLNENTIYCDIEFPFEALDNEELLKEIQELIK